MKKKILVLLMVVAMSATMMLGCGEKSTEDTTNESQESIEITTEVEEVTTTDVDIEAETETEEESLETSVSNETTESNENAQEHYQALMEFTSPKGSEVQTKANFYVSESNGNKSLMEYFINFPNDVNVAYEAIGPTDLFCGYSMAPDKGTIAVNNQHETKRMELFAPVKISEADYDYYKDQDLDPLFVPTENVVKVGDFREQNQESTYVEIIYDVSYEWFAKPFKGYRKFILDKQFGYFTKVDYSMAEEIYDDELALETIRSIKFKDFNTKFLDSLSVEEQEKIKK